MVAGTIGSLTYLKQNYVKHHINDTHENLNWLKITKLHFTHTTKAQALLIMMTSQYGMPQLSDKESSGKYMKVSI
jgi:hypothetical protein